MTVDLITAGGATSDRRGSPPRSARRRPRLLRILRAAHRYRKDTPDVVIEDFADDLSTDAFAHYLSAVLKPPFDTLWQATGFPRSMNYNDQGKRTVW